jgi:subtilisin family serine protease
MKAIGFIGKKLVIGAAVTTLAGLAGASDVGARASAERAIPDALSGSHGGATVEATSASGFRRLGERARRRGSVEVVVALEREDAATRKAAVRELRRAGASFVQTFEELPFLVVEANSRTLDALRRSKHVRAVGESRELAAHGGAPTGVSSNQNLAPWWHHFRMDVDDSWKLGYKGSGENVAILDTGVDASHPWFAGKIVRQACFARYSNTSASGYCPNGYWTQVGGNAGTSCTFEAGCAHGTHVAGIAAGENGVASAAGIIAIQIFHPTNTGCRSWETVPCARTDNGDILAALNHVYELRSQLRITAVNLSVGGGARYAGFCDSADATYAAVARAVDNLRAVGISTVVSAGNDGDGSGLSFPACISDTVPVGNSTLDPYSNDAVFYGVDGYGKPYGSNSGANMWFLAPGTTICSAVPSRFRPGNDPCGAGTAPANTMGGTSMAAPQVTGALAALRQLRPSAAITSRLNALWYSGTFVADTRNGLSRPRINVMAALTYHYNNN